MKLGFIGLGRMGHAMVLHLLEQGVDVVVFNRTAGKIDALSQEAESVKHKAESSGKLITAYTIDEMIKWLDKPRIIWLMVPQGKPVDEMMEKLLSAGIGKEDILIDGGNSFYKDSIRRYQQLKEKGVHFLDIGTSGGLEGARNGACVMVGGDKKIYEKVRPVLEKVAIHDGATYMGPSGAGHFVKMVHNGVEYGMLESLGEGFEILFNGPYQLNFEEIAKNWSHGSVVRGWLVELLERAFAADPKLEKIEGVIGGGTTGGWTIEIAKELNVSAPVIADSLEVRKKSLSKPTFSGKVVAALRREFGGHEVKKRKG
ncbi:decarboxylating 6-phosphogluconate dehydrogenase [Patescibacteria group bacterium]|nr:decarboxylating 6-phosphogluconate dehydrogenase [Patescibacteria group bacterium]